MSCQQSNYTITVGGLVDPQDLSFEINGSITITFVAPSGHHLVTPITYSPNPPPTGETGPSITSNSVTFVNPQGATTDYDVVVPYAQDTGASSVVIWETPTTTIKFKPRTRCPS
ncbi:hypothetical protein ACNOYE_03195 [Nannocystaceae bacterium ST9]